VFDLSALFGGGKPLPPGSSDVAALSCGADRLVSGGLYATEDPLTPGVSTVVEQSGASADNVWRGVISNDGTVPVHDFLSLICAPASTPQLTASAAPRVRGHRVRSGSAVSRGG
jgi:hypothetical protein